MGIVTRQTRDCDVLHPALPSEICEAAKVFAATQRERGEVLDDDWLNDGPSSLIDVLPEGWLERLQAVYRGKAITLHCLGRMDLLMSKLFALCDRGIDLQDCVALSPTVTELDEVLPWLEQQDANPGWPEHARNTLNDLRRRLNDGL